MKHLLYFLLLTISGAVYADADTAARLSQLKTELSNVQQEQQSAYQNFQMTMELRRIEVQEASPPMNQYPYGMDLYTPPPNYDEVLRIQLEREKRIHQYTDFLSTLSERFLRLEEQRKQIIQQIRELEQHPKE
ncbi:MAG: hypothetical protein Q7U91_16495 [Sideroxyarcus sp.]|nr:hypothetical protein [Sideroxyarcus sp.]